jgi:hypothetical protein
MHALIENGTVKKYPYSLSDIKIANLNTSFPSTISDASMAEYGAMRVFNTTPPELTDTQVLEEDTPVFSNEDQRWTQVLRVRDMTAEEVQQRNDAKALEIRTERNGKLDNSDWTQIADSTADKAVWATYRQALRDLTSQESFPWNVTWPEQPE